VDEPKRRRGKEKDAEAEEEGGEEQELGDEFEEEEEDDEEQEDEEEEVMEERVNEMERARQIADERIRSEQRKQWLRTLRDKRIIVRYVHPQPIYLLFNPWHESTSYVVSSVSRLETFRILAISLSLSLLRICLLTYFPPTGLTPRTPAVFHFSRACRV